MLHTFNDNTIIYDVVYKKRKSVAIFVDGYGHIEVRAPKGIEQGKIVALLEEKWDGVLQMRQQMLERLNGPPLKTYTSGEIFHYLGQSFPIEIKVDQQRDEVRLLEDRLVITVRQEEDASIKQALKRFYYQRCKALVEERIRHYQGSFKVKPRSISIVDTPTTWGTCDGQLRLTFNWKLAMAPVEVIDYIVVHEMCHLVHLNHDRSFWRLVGKLLPDYKERQAWLERSAWQMEL